MTKFTEMGQPDSEPMNYWERRLQIAIIENEGIREWQREEAYSYLHGYLSTFPPELRKELGTEAEIVKNFVAQAKNIVTISDCIDRLKFFNVNLT